MSDYGKTYMLTFLLCFWTILTILSNYLNDAGYLDEPILENSISELQPNFMDAVLYATSTPLRVMTDLISDIPLLNTFAPLFKMMQFTYTDNIPNSVSLILAMFSLFSGWQVYSMIRGD